MLFNISLRMLHTKKQAAAGRPFVTGLQYVLRETPLGPLFFGSVAKVLDHCAAVDDLSEKNKPRRVSTLSSFCVSPLSLVVIVRRKYAEKGMVVLYTHRNETKSAAQSCHLDRGGGSGRWGQTAEEGE